jgi:hypothetical protein
LKAKLPIEHQSLVTLTSQFMNIPEIAVIKDFLIIKLLSNLVKSEWFPNVIFKGGLVRVTKVFSTIKLLEIIM